MDYIVSIPKQAEKDLREVFLWDEEKKPGLGFLFKDFLKTAISSIKQNPLKFQIRYKNIRSRFLNKLPFGVHYWILESEIIILAVFHTSLEPKMWQKK